MIRGRERAETRTQQILCGVRETMLERKPRRTLGAGRPSPAQNLTTWSYLGDPQCLGLEVAFRDQRHFSQLTRIGPAYCNEYEEEPFTWTGPFAHGASLRQMEWVIHCIPIGAGKKTLHLDEKAWVDIHGFGRIMREVGRYAALWDRACSRYHVSRP